jgi:hypothetical protein
MVAYIGGKNIKGLATGKSCNNIIGSKFGLLKSKTNLSAVHLKRAATLQQLAPKQKLLQ